MRLSQERKTEIRTKVNNYWAKWSMIEAKWWAQV